jgi:type II secretory pathway pseudopilin PulG
MLPAQSRRQAEAGLTLAETLAVLVMIGIASAAAVIGLRPQAGSTPSSEAARLASSLRLAADQALATQETLALVWGEGFYGFRRWSGAGGGWQPLPAGPLATDRPLPAVLALRRQGGGDSLLPLRPDALAIGAVIEVAGQGAPQFVVFDGLSAEAMEEAAP